MNTMASFPKKRRHTLFLKYLYNYIRFITVSIKTIFNNVKAIFKFVTNNLSKNIRQTKPKVIINVLIIINDMNEMKLDTNNY